MDALDLKMLIRDHIHHMVEYANKLGSSIRMKSYDMDDLSSSVRITRIVISGDEIKTKRFRITIEELED